MPSVESIASMSSQMSREALASKVSTRVARVALDNQESQGKAAIALLDGALKLAKSASDGSAQSGRLDVTA
jgi:hypothetical protein